MNKLEINSALWNLVERKDIEASAAIVIKFGNALRRSSLFTYESRSTTADESGPMIEGLTPQGQVSLTDESNNKVKETQYGLFKERIGHFKMWKDSSGDILWFQHFWKSDLTTSSETEEVPLFRIRYDAKTLQLKHFGVMREIPIIDWWIFHFGREAFDPIFGEDIEYGCYVNRAGL